MKKFFVIAAVIAVLSVQGVFGAESDSLKVLVKDEARIVKEFPVERHLDAAAANQMASVGKAVIVDIRTPQEYQLIGHVPGTYNIPVSFWGKWDDQKKVFGWDQNPDFVKQFANVFPDKSAAYILMCRSGHRSAKAVKTLHQAGYANLYQMWDGFEGSAVADKTSPNFGKKLVDGWKNKNLPWTYDMDPVLIVRK
jgi:rhodanese-related sulfurtransferase